MRVYPIFEIFMVCSGSGRLKPRFPGRLNVLSMVRSGRKIVNSPIGILFDNRTQN